MKQVQQLPAEGSKQPSAEQRSGLDAARAEAAEAVAGQREVEGDAAGVKDVEWLQASTILQQLKYIRNFIQCNLTFVP